MTTASGIDDETPAFAWAETVTHTNGLLLVTIRPILLILGRLSAFSPNQMTTERLRTLLIGIDAACRPVLDQLAASGDVPTLTALFDDGVVGDLTSQVPPWTPSAWPSVYTGANPGRHGVFGFLGYDGYDWDVVNATDVREWTLWELLDYHGLQSVVVNGPVTHPPPEIDGAVVPGYVAPEDPDCHPPGLLDEVRSAVGPYRVYGDTDHDSASPTDYRELVEMRGRAFRYLLDEFDPHFGFVQFQQTDTVFHERPHDQAAIREVYRAVDDEVAAIVDDYDPEVVVVASDHGIGEYGGYEFRVNDYLRERGYVETRAGGSGMPSWGVAGVAFQRGERDAPDGPNGPVESALAAVSAVGVTSQRVGAVLGRLGLREFVLERAPTTLVKAAEEGVGFHDSRAYMRSRVELGVRINLAGREPSGVVPAERYDEVREELISALRTATTPEGEAVFSTVAPREEVFEGPYVSEAPDVVVVPNEYDHYLSAQIRDEPFVSEPREPWNHKLRGVVSVTGSGVDVAAGVGDAHLFDVAPTVLATLGLPAGTRMDGDPLPAVEPAGVTEYPPYEGGCHRATDDTAVEGRLADMGYLE